MFIERIVLVHYFLVNILFPLYLWARCVSTPFLKLYWIVCGIMVPQYKQNGVTSPPPHPHPPPPLVRTVIRPKGKMLL